jgi:negative regulator of sigma E activity
VLYVEGRNGGEMFARRGGTRFSYVTTRLRPESDLAMRGNRYPVTQFGIENLVYRLLLTARGDLETHCDVDILPDAKVNDRPARAIIVTHQSAQENPEYYQARIFVDKELELPVHFESYDWPKTPDQEPELLEQYSYTQLQLNRGLTDADFSENNPQYHVI